MNQSIAAVGPIEYIADLLKDGWEVKGSTKELLVASQEHNPPTVLRLKKAALVLYHHGRIGMRILIDDSTATEQDILRYIDVDTKPVYVNKRIIQLNWKPNPK